MKCEFNCAVLLCELCVLEYVELRYMLVPPDFVRFRKIRQNSNINNASESLQSVF